MSRSTAFTLKALAVLTLLPLSLNAIDIKTLKPTGYVNDFAGVIDAAGKQQLEAYCANLERATGSQMAIVTLPTIDDEPIDDLANKLFIQWGIGKKGKDEGILILLAIKERKYRVEVGYGLEPYITDGASGTVMRGILPILRQGNYGGGLLAAAQQFGSTIAQAKGVALDQTEPLPRVAPAQRNTVHIPFPLIIIGIFILLSFLSRGNRGGGIGPGGGGGSGILPGLILGSMMGGRRGGWGGGGFGGGFGGGGGGGFGGFGGGDSGGGGASGGW